jgi:hypothetical protein
MYKLLKVLIPTSQVLAFIAVRILLELSKTNDRIYFNYYLPAQSLVERLNYPLMAFWLSIDSIANRLHLPNPSAESAFAVSILAAGIVLLSSVAVFWYLVVREIELRKEGKSLFRFSGWIRPVVTVIVLFCAGADAVFSAYIDASKRLPFMVRNGSALGLFLTILPEIFLLAWAISLIGMAVSDFRRFIRNRRHDCALAGSE